MTLYWLKTLSCSALVSVSSDVNGSCGVMHVNENGSVVIRTLVSPARVQSQLWLDIAVGKPAFAHQSSCFKTGKAQMLKDPFWRMRQELWNGQRRRWSEFMLISSDPSLYLRCIGRISPPEWNVRTFVIPSWQSMSDAVLWNVLISAIFSTGYGSSRSIFCNVFLMD